MAVIDTSLAPDYKLTVEDSNGVVKEVDLANALFVNSITNQLDTTSAMAVRDAVDDTATLSSHLLVGTWKPQDRGSINPMVW